ncbi:hypothetical protein CNR22_08685 [Sphingobacteriaceae bacterium]|nr:hypothetical protein CNR22_08685 [Sphingobacteriaceae bacterium]
MKIRYPELLIATFIFAILCIIAFTTTTTGDSGDGINHYLYSHYAFKYPDIFFNHWAKPVFVLFSALPSQFGFTGIQIFNFICALASALLAFYTLKNLKVKYTYLIFVFLFFSPLYFKLLFSGLTEYLFALILSLGIYLESKSKHNSALILISFLPLVRSEGLLIVGVFALYFIFLKKYRQLPLLLSGQALYSIVGAIYHKDFLWVFNEIPYLSKTSPYGHGEMFDFVNRLNYTIEKPIYLLLLVGIFVSFYKFLKNTASATELFKMLVIGGSFIIFFIAHSIFWWKGIFNSMGLPRVLISVLPLIAMLCVFGLDFLLEKIKNTRLKYIALGTILFLVVLYPFTNRPQGVVFNRNLFVIPENELIAKEVVPFIQKEFPDYKTHFFYYSHPFLSIALNIDPFDYRHHKEITNVPADYFFAKNTLVIWDDWYSSVEGRITWEQMKNDHRFELLKEFSTIEKGRVIKLAVFRSIEGF